MSHMEWTAEESGIRLDKFLSTVSDLSRTRVQELTKAGEVFVNGTMCFIVLAGNNTAGCLFINPMDNARSDDTVDTGQIGAVI